MIASKNNFVSVSMALRRSSSKDGNCFLSGLISLRFRSCSHWLAKFSTSAPAFASFSIRRTCNKSDPADCARAILRPFATHAFRRPATDEEVDRLTRLVVTATKEGDSFERGIQVALQA